MGKIWDVTPPQHPTQPKTASTEVMITELFVRGVSIEQIFAQFYALEAQADAWHDEIFGNDEEGQHGDPNRFGKHKPLTVGDALLVGLISRDMPTGEVPF